MVVIGVVVMRGGIVIGVEMSGIVDEASWIEPSLLDECVGVGFGLIWLNQRHWDGR